MISQDRTDGTGKTGGSVSKVGLIPLVFTIPLSSDNGPDKQDLLSARAWISRAKERFHKPSGHRGYNKLQ
jgi:hypothetical protein